MEYQENGLPLEAKISIGNAIEAEIRKGNYATADYLIKTAPKDMPVEPFYAAMAITLTQKYEAEEGTKNLPQTTNMMNMLMDYFKNKAGDYLKNGENGQNTD